MSTLSVNNIESVFNLTAANINVANTITIGSPTANVLMSGSQLSINGQNVSPVQSFRNKIINGNFDFWQRGTSNTSIASGQYVADRWNHTRVGSTANVSRQSFTVGQTDVPNEPSYFHRTTVTSSAGSSNYCLLEHRIESVRTLAGQTATLSFWAKADASKNMAVEFFQYFGTGGSPSSSVFGIDVTTCALTTSWKKFAITVNIPSISGKTLGSDNNDFIRLGFWFDGGSSADPQTNSLGQQSGTFDIAQVQLEAGSVATPFEVRPLGVELQLCQRYYELWGGETSYQGFGIADAGSTTGMYSFLQYGTPKRASPTCSVSSASHFHTVRGSVIMTSITFQELTKTHVFVTLQSASGLTAGQAYTWRSSNTTDARIIFSAEL